jgi:hypothetical protein
MKRTIVTIETRQKTVVHRSSGQTVGWCDRCGAEVVMLKPNEASAFVRITAVDFFRRIEAGELHFLVTDDGLLLICRNLPAEESWDSEKDGRYEDGEHSL